MTKPEDSPFRPSGGVSRKPDDLGAAPTAVPGEVLDSTGEPIDESVTETSPVKRHGAGAPAPKGVDEATAVRPPSVSQSRKASSTQPRQPQPKARDAGPVATEAAGNAPATVPRELTELSARLDRQINAALDVVGAMRQGVDETRMQRQQLLAEAETVNRNYKQLVEKLVSERDSLARELKESRARFAADTESQVKASAQAQRDLKNELSDAGTRLREGDAEIERQNQRIAELELQLKEAIASRDRIADRVSEVEDHLERGILPLREENEQARAREALARTDLDAAKKEIAALKLLASGPQK